MGDIITIQDTYKFILPEQPRFEKEILFYDKKKSEQMWIRPQMPDMRRLSIREKSLFIDEERRRIEEGVWMMLKGEIVYLTGGHYDFLRYNNYPDFNGNPIYYDAQRLDFYFQEIVALDENCYGELVIKPRRYGYTAIAISRAIRKAMSEEGMHIGLASTDKDKVIETMFRPLTESFMSRPKYARADIYTPNGKVPQKEMRFIKNIVKKNEDDTDFFGTDEEGLKSWISPRSTTAKTFDGHKWHFIIMDEIYKWTKASLYNTWNITKEALQVGGIINGKAALFATMGDDESYDAAVKDGIKLWNESDYHNRNKYGQTKSGLFRYFIPAYVAYAKFIDKYGKCDQDAAKEYLQDQRNEIISDYGEDSKEYLYYIRKYPFTAEEAMESVGESGTFSRMRLESHLRSLTVVSSVNKPYVQGYFKPKDYGAEWHPDKKGVWKFKALPSQISSNRCKYLSKKKEWLLPDNPEGLIGNDPVRTADNTSDHKSKNGAFAFKKFDYFNTGNENELIGQLFGRDDEDVDYYNEQLRLACLCLAYPLNTERQITSTYDWFRGRGMKSFIMKWPGKDGKEAYGMWTTTQLIKDGIELIQAYIKKAKEGKDWLSTIVFEELLEQLKEFEKAKSTKFDLVMGLIMTFLGAAQVKYKIVSETKNAQIRSAINAMIPQRS
jgi:hypothetical protein